MEYNETAAKRHKNRKNDGGGSTRSAAVHFTRQANKVCPIQFRQWFALVPLLVRIYASREDFPGGGRSAGLGGRRRKAGWKPALRGCGFAALVPFCGQLRCDWRVQS